MHHHPAAALDSTFRHLPPPPPPPPLPPAATTTTPPLLPAASHHRFRVFRIALDSIRGPPAAQTRARDMNPANAGQQGVAPPNQLQHPRSAGLMPQQHRSDSPQQPPHTHLQSAHPGPGPYASPHSSNHSLSQHHQSPYIASLPNISHQHHPAETNSFYGAHPSPYTNNNNSAPGSYASSEPGDTMATQAAMSRTQYPPISSYQTPQSNSPASMHSPQTDAHGRPMYGIPSMPQQMYYSPQYQMQQSPYAQHPSGGHHPSITSAPGQLMGYAHAMHQSQSQHSSQPQSIIDTKPTSGSLQRPASVIAPPHGTPQTPSGPGLPNTSSSGSNQVAAPGPIPATTPLVVRQDNNGVQWIAFEYSRDRVKMEYTIRCDVESVNTEELSPDFKAANCVYPRACNGKDQYKGNRLQYETECNNVGWALAQLNPPLRDKRGLIQRAVDSWRNSNQDVKLRSRRVRRMAKMHTRKSGPGMGPGSGPPSAGIPGSQAGNEYNSAPAHHHQAPVPSSNNHQDIGSPASSTHRYVAQNFYPTYPHQPHAGGPGPIPSVHEAMDGLSHQASSTLAAPAVKAEEEESRKRKLFGDVPDAKRRKFILVDDGHRGTRVRVRVTLDQVNLEGMPDAHLKINSVYPRSYFSRQYGSGSPSAVEEWADDVDEDEPDLSSPRRKTTVRVPLLDGSDAEMHIARITKGRRSKEVALNELGARMSWQQARTFHGRTLFLQKSLDAYRNKMRSTMVANGQDANSVAPHFITRPGKAKWHARNRRSDADSP